jgi:hypothetical protein
MRTRLIAINGSAGAFTPVFATQPTRRVEILEDFSANAGIGQGLAYQFDDGQMPHFTTIYEIAPQTEPIVLGDPIPQNHGFGLIVGRGPDASGGYTLAATLLINLRSVTTTGTVVRVTEFD